MTRLKPDQIQPGCSYRLMPRYSYIPGLNLIRRVEAIDNGNVVVLVNGKEVRMPAARLRGAGGGGSTEEQDAMQSESGVSVIQGVTA